MALLGRFAKNGEGATCGHGRVEEDGDLAIGRTSKDLVELWMPVDRDKRRARCDWRDKLWAKCCWVEDV